MTDDVGYEGVKITSRKEEAAQACRLRCLYIRFAVTDNETAFALNCPMIHQIVDHARRRFTPGMICDIACNRSGRMMRAIAYVVDTCITRSEFGDHPVVKTIDLN